MKKTILIIAVIIPAFVYSQISNIELDFSKAGYPIKYDYKDGTTGNFVKHGDNIKFTIININKQLYDATIKGETVSYTSEIPASLKIFAGVSEPDEVPPPADPASMTHARYGENKSTVRLGSDYSTAYNKFKNAVKNLEDAKINYLHLQAFSQTEIDENHDVASLIAKCKTLITNWRADENIQAKIIELKEAVETAKFDEEKAYDDLPDADGATTEEKLDKLISALQENTQAEVATKLKTSDQLSEKDKKILQRSEELHKKANELMKLVNDFDYIDLGKKITKLYNTIKSANYYTVTSSNIQADGDELDFTYKVTPKTNLDYNTPSNEIKETHLKLWVKGGCQFKFGVGIGFNTIGLLNKTFTLQTRDSIIDGVTGNTEAQVEISEDRKNDWFIPNTVAYVHFLTRVARFTSIGGSIGVNLDFKEIKSSGFNLGFTTAFGTKYSVALTLGTSFGMVDVINGKYQTNKIYKQVDVDISNITKNAFRCGLFFGISVNLTSTETRK